MSRNIVVLACLVLLQVYCSTAALVASPAVLSRSNQIITVSWKGVANPSSEDLILLHSPDPDALSNDTRIGHFSVTLDPNWATGSGSFSFPLVNLRADVIFEYVLISKDRIWKTADISNPVKVQNIAEPTQGHLALTNNPQEMRVMWVSGSNKFPPSVRYGTTPSELNMSQSGTSSTYTAADLCAAPANSTRNGGWREPGWQHDVLLQNLKLNAKYYYQFGNSQEGWSPVTSFVTSPGVGPNITLDFIMFGDMGVKAPFNKSDYWVKLGIDQQEMAPKSLKWISRYVDKLANQPKLILDVGDISYARGYAVLWDYYMEAIAPIATQAPWMVGIGNHEYDYPAQPWRPGWSPYGDDSLGECAVPYSNRFHMPSETYQGLRNLWYSFEMGPVHFTFMSTEHDFLIGSDQYNWLANDLQKVNRKLTPWIIVTAHRPFYTSSCCSVGNTFDNYLRQHVQPLLYKNKVDLVLVGHVHAYERMCGFTENFTCAERDEDGVVHIIVGGAGNMYQTPWDTAAGSDHKNQPDWSIFRSDEWGISELRANGTTLHLTFYGDQRGEVHDELILRK